MAQAKTQAAAVMLKFQSNSCRKYAQKKLSIADQQYLALYEVRATAKQKLLRLRLDGDWVDAFLVKNFKITKKFSNWRR